MGDTPDSAIARLRRAVFARHSNPWSAWSRWASMPLIMVPVWTRSRRQAALLAAWMAVNPVIFPKPADDRAWASRAMLGEELWLIDHPMDAGMGLNAAATAASFVSAAAAYRHRPVASAVACATSMALLLGYWEAMARYYDRHREQESSTGRTSV